MLHTARLARPRHLLCSVGLILGLSAASLAAPPVLDRVPTDALVVVAAPSLDRLSKSIQTVTSSVHMPMPMPGLTEMLAMSGFEKGVDTTKSIAVVMLSTSPEEAAKAKAAAAAKKADPKKAADEDEDDDAEDGPAPAAVVLVPIADYGALLGNFNAKPGAAGAIDSVTVSDKPMFMKNVGDGYAAMSDKKENLERFSGKAGNAKAHETALGKTCGAIADASDLVVIANMPAIKADPGFDLKQQMRQMARNAGPMAGPMGGGEQMDQAAESLGKVMDQSRIAVMGMRADASGVALDMGAQFNEGTDLAKSFSKPGNASSLIKKLPKQDYLFAFAADMSDPTARDLAKKMNPAAQMAGDAGDKDADHILTALMGPMEKADGMAVSLGASPAAMMGGGLFTNTVAYFRTPDAAAYMKATEDALKTLNQKNIQGTSLETTYTPNTSKVNDVSVDTWSVKMTPDEDDGMAGQIMMGLFGPNGGPAGYVAKADGGVVRTMGKNSLLMSAALDAAKGNNSMAADTLVSQVSEKLAPGRSIEAYVGIKSFLDMVKPMMAMMGGGADPEIPDVIPPIGFGMGGADGAGRATVFIPMPVIKAISNVAQAFQGAGMGGEMEEEEDAPAPKGAKPGDKGAGQPKF